MSVLVGPVTHLGAPFDPVHAEAVIEQEVAGQLCYVFGNGFLDVEADVFIEPREPLEALVLWDPSWLRTGITHRRLASLRDRYPGILVVGVMSDWFAGWHGGGTVRRTGTRKALELLDRVVIDGYGAAAIRRQHFATEIRELSHFLSYSRLPTISRAPLSDTVWDHERPIDVAFVGNDHPGFVWHRPALLEQLELAAAQYDWKLVIRNDLSAAEMEAMLLQTKVVVNSQLGTQRNMRMYEAAACGCAIVSDQPGADGAYWFNEPDYDSAIWQVKRLLESTSNLCRCQRSVHRWVQDHTPEATWTRIFDTALS